MAPHDSFHDRVTRSAPRVLGTYHLDDVAHRDGQHDQHDRNDESKREPVMPDLGCKKKRHGSDRRCPASPWAYRDAPRGASGDLAAPRAGDRHGLMEVAVLALVVDRQPRVAPRMAAEAILVERPRRTVRTVDGGRHDGSIGHIPANHRRNRPIPRPRGNSHADRGANSRREERPEQWHHRCR